MVLIFAIRLVLAASEAGDNNLMNYEEYAKVVHTIPYIFIENKNNQYLYYFGADHTWDPKHKQFKLLQEFWQQFLDKTRSKNCVVLVESNLRNLWGSKTKEEAIRRSGGEGGFITFLANQANIDIMCPEPEEKQIFEELQKKYSADVLLYKKFAQAVLCAIRANKSNKSVDIKDWINNCLSKHNNYFGLFSSLEQIELTHKILFDFELNLLDEDFFYKITNPVDADSMINKACRDTSTFRDLYIINYIKQLFEKGKSVFIVYGATHAVMQEKALL